MLSFEVWKLRLEEIGLSSGCWGLCSVHAGTALLQVGQLLLFQVDAPETRATTFLIVSSEEKWLSEVTEDSRKGGKVERSKDKGKRRLSSSAWHPHCGPLDISASSSPSPPVTTDTSL